MFTTFIIEHCFVDKEYISQNKLLRRKMSFILFHTYKTLYFEENVQLRPPSPGRTNSRRSSRPTLLKIFGNTMVENNFENIIMKRRSYFLLIFLYFQHRRCSSSHNSLRGMTHPTRPQHNLPFFLLVHMCLCHQKCFRLNIAKDCPLTLHNVHFGQYVSFQPNKLRHILKFAS